MKKIYIQKEKTKNKLITCAKQKEKKTPGEFYNLNQKVLNSLGKAKIF